MPFLRITPKLDYQCQLCSFNESDYVFLLSLPFYLQNPKESDTPLANIFCCKDCKEEIKRGNIVMVDLLCNKIKKDILQKAEKKEEVTKVELCKTCQKRYIAGKDGSNGVCHICWSKFEEWRNSRVIEPTTRRSLKDIVLKRDKSVGCELEDFDKK